MSAPLINQAAINFQLEYKNRKFLTIDEMFVVGRRLLKYAEERCSEIFPNNEQKFGGINVYLFGDYRQLPPVLDIPVYADRFFDDAYEPSTKR